MNIAVRPRLLLLWLFPHSGAFSVLLIGGGGEDGESGGRGRRIIFCLFFFFFCQWKSTFTTEKEQRRTFLLCKETGMQIRATMVMKTGKVFADPSAMTKQMRQDSDSWSLPPLTILWWRTLLVITKHPEVRLGNTQMDNTTNRLITF